MRAPSWIRFLLLGMMAAVAAAGALVLFALLRDPGTSQALIPLPVQPFAADAQGGISTNKLGQDITANWTVTQALQGERTTLPGIFSGPGFSLDLDKEIVDGTQVGTVWSSVDANCNGVVDYMADDPMYPGGPAPNPPFEPWLSPLKWYEATTAVESDPDQVFLKSIMPPFSWLVRHKVDIDHLCIDVWGGAVVFPSVLNTVYAAIPYSPNGSTFVAQTKLGGSPTTPPSSVCLDSPQSSESVTTVYNTPPNEGDIDGVCNAADPNIQCADAGIYGMWTDNTVAIASGGGTQIEVEKHIVNNGPEAGDFEELWETESTNANITAKWDANNLPVYSPNLVLPVGEDTEQFMDLNIACTVVGNYWGLVVIKNLLSPIPPTEDTFLDDNAFTFVVLVKCGTPTTTPEVDKEVSLIKAFPSHIAPPAPGVSVPVLIDELKANHATTDVPGDEWLVAEVGDVVDPVGPDLTLAWVPAVIVTAPGHDTQTPAVAPWGAGGITFPVNEWPGQADVNATLIIACPATTPPGLYPVVVKAIDVPTAGFESKPSDNAQRKVITVRCGGPADDGIVDGNGLYARWTILQSMGSTSLNKSGDLRKDYKSPPSIPSDSGYVERIIDLQCFWIDDDGCTTCDADSNGYLSEVESWNDPDLLAMGGGIGTVDADGDCLIDAAYAQPGHPVDLPTISGTCDPLQYSEYPMVVIYSKAADADCDGLVDGVEKAWGSNPLLADSDSDGTPDFVEMFQFTNPLNPDTDGDGLLDRPDDDYIAAAAGSAESGEAINADDNCPSVYNPDQLNSDGRGRWNGAVPNDYASNPNKDKMGDACDEDDDNDGATDAYEIANGTNPLKLDTDGDTVNDGAELRLGTNPNNPLPPLPAWGPAQQVYYRGGQINVPAQGAYPAWDQEYDGLENGVEMDVDGDGILSPVDTDSDNGTGTGSAAPIEILDSIEAFGYNTAIANKDTDGDGCADWIEIVDVNGNRSAEILDAWLVARTSAPSDSDNVLDINKNGRPPNPPLPDPNDIGLAVSNSQMVKTHAPCSPSPQAGPPDFRLRIDALEDVGGTWCDPVDDAATRLVGGTYQVAICLENPPAAVAAFQVEVAYDDSLGVAPMETPCPTGDCLDDNPDANAGGTTWGTPLGSAVDWDCNVRGLSEPVGDIDSGTGAGRGRARIACWSLNGPYTLNNTGPLAVLTLQATNTGTQELELENVIVGDGNGVERGSCNPALGLSVPCEGAAVTGVLAPTPTPTSTPGAPTPDPSLVAHWKLDEGSGTAASDSSGNGNDGTLNGPTWVAGRVGSALSFDGTSDYVDVPDDDTLDLTTGATVMGWVKVDATTGYVQVLVSKWFACPGEWESAWVFEMEPDGITARWSTTIGTGFDMLLSNSTVPLGTWFHYAATYDGSVKKIYINGQETASRAVPGTLGTNSNPLEIGRNAFVTCLPEQRNWFKGTLDDIRIYNRALTAQEIRGILGGSGTAVGGIAELPDAAGSAAQVSVPGDGSGWSVGDCAALAGGLAAAAIAIVGGGWYARRRYSS